MKKIYRKFAPLEDGDIIQETHQMSINGKRYRRVKKKCVGLIYNSKMFWPIRKPVAKEKAMPTPLSRKEFSQTSFYEVPNV